MADWNCIINRCGQRYVDRVDARGNPLAIPAGYPGAGSPVEYGYLTPREAKEYHAKPLPPAEKPFTEAAE